MQFLLKPNNNGKKKLHTWTSMKLSATPPINYVVLLLQYSTPITLWHILFLLSPVPFQISPKQHASDVYPFLHNAKVTNLYPYIFYRVFYGKTVICRTKSIVLLKLTLYYYRYEYTCNIFKVHIFIGCIHPLTCIQQ